MITSFWSNVHGQTATTTNLLAIAIMAVLYRKEKVAILQSHFNLNNLDAPLTGGANLNDFDDIGIDALIRDIKSSPLSEERIINDSISLLNKKLNLFPSTQKLNRTVFEIEMLNIFDKIMRDVSKVHDQVFVDVNAGDSPLTKKIMEHSDLIVVNLSQNKAVIQDYMDKYDFPKEKTIYLFGNYNYNSRSNKNNLIRIYKKLTKKNTTVIPYNVEYLDALNEGNTILFLMKNMNCNKDDDNYYFIQMIKKAADMIGEYGKEDLVAIH